LFLLDTSGKALEVGILAKPYLVKPNLEELESLWGEKFKSLAEQAKAVADLKKRGIRLPCLTLGKNGCLAGMDDGVYHFYAAPLEVVNTVGSGDSFLAGCAVALRRGLSPMEVIKLGMACGMANTQFFETGMISRELVERYLKLVKFNKVLNG